MSGVRCEARCGRELEATRRRALALALLVGLAAAGATNARAQGCERQRQRLKAGEFSQGLVAADFDGLQGLDLATTDVSASGSLVLFFNQGDDSFAERVLVPTSIEPWHLVTADFDGRDGPDLAAAGPGGAVEVFLNNGDGSFRSGGPIVTGPSFTLAVADLDGLAGPDLVVAGDDDPAVNLALLLNQGDGTFSAPRLVASPVAHAVAVGDLDGLSGPDVVIAGDADSSLFVFLNDGTGDLGMPTELVLPDHSNGLAIGDLDGLNGPDLVAGLNWDPEALVFLNRGDGSFEPPASYPVGELPRPVLLADLDGGGTLDLVVGADNELSILRGVGDGSFLPSVAFGSGDTALGVEANALVAAELDTRTGLDLAFYDWFEGAVVVLTGDGSGSPSAPRLPEPRHAVTGPDGWARFLTALDLDGVEGRDVVLGMGWSADGALVSWHGGPDGDLVRGAEVLTGGELLALDSADLDGDGLSDVVAATADELVVFLNDGTGLLVEADRRPEGAEDLRLAEVDGVNGPDLLLVGWGGPTGRRLQVLLNDGAGGFAAPSSSSLAASDTARLATGDFLPGGGLDVALLQADDWVSTGELVVLEGDGTGAFVERGRQPLDAPLNDLAAAELDDAPGTDLVVARGYASELVQLSSDGVGGFVERARHAVGANADSLRVADLDGLHGPDLLAASWGSDDLAVLLHDGAGGLAAPVRLLGGDGAEDVVAVDLDGRGGPELVVADSDSNELRIVTALAGCLDLAPPWLLRDDSITSLRPPVPSLDLVLGAGLRLEGPNGLAEAGEGANPELPGSDDDDHAYVEGLTPGSLDPDAQVGSDATRPLVFYRLSTSHLTLRLSRTPDGRLRFDY